MNTKEQPLENKEQSLTDKMLTSFIYDSNARGKINTYFMVIVGLIFVLFVWSFLTSIDQTVNIKGQIMPRDGIARIKHESGGEIIKIHVKNYDNVKKGQLLLTINNDKILTGLKQNKSKLKVLDTEIFTIISYLKNNLKGIGSKGDLKDVETYLNNISDTMTHSRQLARATKLSSDHKDQVIVQQIRKNKIEINRLNDEVVVLDDQLQYLDEQRTIFQKLLATKNVSKIRALDYEVRYREVLREFKRAKSDLIFKARETSELESRRIVQKQDDIREKYEDLVALNKEKIDIVSNISQLETSLKNLNIKAPMSGIVQGLEIVRGVTVQPGEEVLSIIPTDSPMVFEAQASLEQKGKMNIESNAEIQFDGFNILQFNRTKGKIVNISPYTFNDNPTKDDFFKVVVSLDSTAITSKNKNYKVKPGMSGILYVSTDKQSLFAYLFGPIYNAFSHVYDQK